MHKRFFHIFTNTCYIGLSFCLFCNSHLSEFCTAITVPQMGQFIMSRNVFIPVLGARESNLNVIALGKVLLAASWPGGRHPVSDGITWQKGNKRDWEHRQEGQTPPPRRQHRCTPLCPPDLSLLTFLPPYIITLEFNFNVCFEKVKHSNCSTMLVNMNQNSLEVLFAFP